MAERRLSRPACGGAAVALAVALAVAWAMLGASAAAAAEPGASGARGASGVVAFVPGEQGPTQPAGGGGLDVGLLVMVGAGVAIAGAVVGGGFLVLRRRPSSPQAPPSPAEGGDWWTCRTCGRNNLVGSARCYACGTWQR